MDEPTLQVKYGNAYRVEFRLCSPDGKCPGGVHLEGRYLDPATPWELRPAHSDDPEQAAAVAALLAVLKAYDTTEILEADMP